MEVHTSVRASAQTALTRPRSSDADSWAQNGMGIRAFQRVTTMTTAAPAPATCGESLSAGEGVADLGGPFFDCPPLLSQSPAEDGVVVSVAEVALLAVRAALLRSNNDD